MRKLERKRIYILLMNGKFNIYELEGIRRIHDVRQRRYWEYRDCSSKIKRINKGTYGTIINNGRSLCLFERNDRLAKDMFIEYQKVQLSKYEKQIKIIKNKIKLLEE